VIEGRIKSAQQPQQTGVLPRQTQQVQPAFIMAVMQSQHDWIMAQQAGSPLVQVILTPSSVISHLHMPMTRLQQQAIIPFIIMQQVQQPPASIVQRLWSIPADMLSSHLQVIVIPPVHFAMTIVHRGTIIIPIPGIIGAPPGAPMPMPIGPPIEGADIPGIPIIAERSTIIVAIGASSRSWCVASSVPPTRAIIASHLLRINRYFDRRSFIPDLIKFIKITPLVIFHLPRLESSKTSAQGEDFSCR
jgi:hypothetical protein